MIPKAGLGAGGVLVGGKLTTLGVVNGVEVKLEDTLVLVKDGSGAYVGKLVTIGLGMVYEGVLGVVQYDGLVLLVRLSKALFNQIVIAAYCYWHLICKSILVIKLHRGIHTERRVSQ